MRIKANVLLESLITTGLLLDAIDTTATNTTMIIRHNVSSADCWLPSTVIRMLLDRQSNKRLHLGVLLLLLKLDSPYSFPQIRVINYLIDNGIDKRAQLDAVIHARSEGISRMLYSNPAIGRRHRAYHRSKSRL